MMAGYRNRTLIAGIIALILVASPLVFSFIARILVDWLWMEELGFRVIFSRTLFLQLAAFGLPFIIIFLFSMLNFEAAVRACAYDNQYLMSPDRHLINISKARLGAVIAILIFSGLFSLLIMSQWNILLQFIWREPFGQTDPIFGLDLGFFLFVLPFFELIQNSLTTLALITLIAVALIYFFFERIPLGRRAMLHITRPVLAHISLLGGLFFVSFAAGYLLDRYELLFSPHRVVYGIGYVEYHAVLAGLWIMFFASLALAAAIVLNIFLRNGLLLVIPVGAFILISVVSLGVVPSFLEKFIVQPKEFDLERPFIENNISLTRKAYLLDRIREQAYSAVDDITPAAIEDNDDTIRNIRLWDWRPILQTYRQTQEIRLYYQFYEVDVDRYHVPGEGYRQVMLSARELSEELPEKARTWVNSTLQFTHGYGLVMSFVTESVGEGLPRYVIEDIPPVSPFFQVAQPALYYAERARGYRIVDTGIRELDYPKGDSNVYTSYRGTGGIPLSSFWKRLLFSWNERDINILISGYLKPTSRIQIRRDIAERMHSAVPFLSLDKDPYLVLSEGRLFWIQDAYTTSEYHPYSEPYQGKRNYIRNSVKAVMDAYNGSLHFYVFDEQDPVIRVYRKAFPGVFRKSSEMPPGIRAHIRYPEDLFAIQIDKYRTYHMTVPQVFYNKEDLWSLPQESYGETRNRMQPYYVLIRLPGEKELQYIMMMPITPQNRNNMIAWVASRSDAQRYGEVLVFKLPKDRIFYGPAQIEAMINQDTVISQQLSLWDQRGSKVIRGNLLVIPLDRSFIYVEPVYLISEGTNIPQLKRVIMAYGGKVVMQPTVGEAVNAIFGTQPPRVPEVQQALPGQAIKPEREKELLEQIREAERSLQKGDWTAFGRAMDKLKAGLSEDIRKGGANTP